MRKYNPKAELTPVEYEELEKAIVEQYAFNKIRVMAAMAKARQEGDKKAEEYFEKLLDTKKLYNLSIDGKKGFGYSRGNVIDDFNLDLEIEKPETSDDQGFLKKLRSWIRKSLNQEEKPVQKNVKEESAETENVGWLKRAVDLRLPFWDAVEHGNPHKLKEILDQSFPVNYREPKTNTSALHYLAARNGRPAIRVLLTHPDIDFLIRDWEGCLASELAYVYSRDPALARLLGIKERKQADAQGIKLTRRPPPEAKP